MMAGANKSNSPKNKKRKLQEVDKAKRVADEKKKRFSNTGRPPNRE
jgi:hypothetical protein